MLVQQAIAVLASSPDDLPTAAGMVDKALDTSDQVGVDVELLRQASDALGAGDAHLARELLERSIGAAPHLNTADPAPIDELAEEETAEEETAEPPGGTGAPEVPTGDDPGAALITSPLENSPELNVGDWVLLAGLIALGAVGVALSLRYRPVAAGTGGDA